jgi:hypothetical protein
VVQFIRFVEECALPPRMSRRIAFERRIQASADCAAVDVVAAEIQVCPYLGRA